ncbi:PAN2-PAN3 deadenylation complex subunit PAN3 isoform X2 [Battus philenor]|uniref:PAN2-PAN3 deadenylation complex subunit PAN3 isoform X2 n=1 Tax=Battus philenor TaxID=42288 RepID=UPI0035CFA761
MDPSIFLQYSPPNGLPQESKLATYMNRSTSTPTRSLNQALGKLSLESSPTAIKKVLINEFVPVNYFTPTNILPESPESSPPSTLVSVPNTQVHQILSSIFKLKENVGGTTYFYATNESLNTSGGLNSSASIGSESCLGASVGPSTASAYTSQMYTGTPTHMGPIVSKPGLAASFYMPETIRAEIYQRNEDVFLQPDIHQFPELPENVEMYSELVPLEGIGPHSLASSFRAAHRQSGEHLALRRLHAYSAVPTKRIDLWKQIDHPNIVRLQECFTTQAFGDHSLILVYDYHPACVTLMSKYLSGSATGNSSEANGTYHDPFSSDPDAPRPYTHQKNAMLRAVACGALLPEAVLWSLLVQLTAALRAIHTAGLACRTLDPTKVVMNGCRVRIAWCGAADAVHPNANDITQAQQDDLTALGRLALALACRTIHCDNLAASMDLVARTYSADLKNLILYLLSNSTARRSVTDLMPMIGARFYTQVEALERRADVFEEQLAHEIDNGRLLRILIKLGVVNERPELNMDASWSETGDRYMLKLFRDYLFHSVTEDGRPWLDQAHLAHCLNQLDGGSNAKVELMSRDEQSVLVVSYAELKHCLEQAFDEVMQAASEDP